MDVLLAGAHEADAKRKRWMPNEEERQLLESMFTAERFPSLTVRAQLGDHLGVPTPTANPR